MKDFSTIQTNVTHHLNELSQWIYSVVGFSPTAQLKFINEQSRKLLTSVGGVSKMAAGSLSGIILFFAILPVYIFLIMMYRNIFMKFILMWFNPGEHLGLIQVVKQIEIMVKSYLAGLLIQITYIIVLLGVVLMLLGIKHAFLIGIIFAFLNLIPYLGALIGNILGILITLASSDKLIDIVIVLVTISVVQLLDNNILMPRIVGSKVKINALVSILGIIIAGAMAGISGMFLAMPVIAIFKIIFDHTTSYKKWGVLLGDEHI